MNEDRELTIRTVDLQVDPERVLEAAVKASKSLQRIVANKAKPVIINGEQYLEYEDWQTLGQFYGYTARTPDAEPVEINGVRGAKARAEVIDFRTGDVIGCAVAYCMYDEDRWTGRPWFQLASMAQTRAAAKALRNRLAWVAVLAGYRPTPAEEMTDEILQSRDNSHWCTIHKMPFRKYTKGSKFWYSHKTSDGDWCSEPAAIDAEQDPNSGMADRIAPFDVAPRKAKDATPGDRNPWPDIPRYQNVGQFYEWALKSFGLKPAAVNKECNVKGAQDFATLDELHEHALRIRAAYGTEPHKAEE